MKKTVFLIPPPGLPVPAVQGGAVETLLTHLIEENEKQGQLNLVCACLPDEAAKAISDSYRHTRVLHLPRPARTPDLRLRSALGRWMGKPLPQDTWYLAVQKAVAEIKPDVIIGEGGNLTELGAVSRMAGKDKCLAHLHGHTIGSPIMDGIYGGVLALSEFIRDAYLEDSTLPRERAFILHNCIDLNRFQPASAEKRLAVRRELGYGEDDFVIVFCGRLAPDKGIHKLMEALALLPEEYKLLVVGSAFFGAEDKDEFTAGLERQAKALGSRVRFTGYVSTEDLPDHYAAADCGCVPTLVEEAAGLSAMEEIACGLPVVATQSGGMPEYLEGSGALLVPRDEELPRHLANAFIRLNGDPQLCARLARLGPKRAADFGVDAYYRRFVTLMNEMR